MNKLFKVITLGILIVIITNCKTQKEAISIIQTVSNEQIIMRMTLEDSTTVGFKFPKKMKIKNNSYLEESFIIVDYFYNDSLSKWANRNIELYKIKN